MSGSKNRWSIGGFIPHVLIMAEAEVYLFTGPEIGDKQEAIANIRARAKKADESLDEYSYYVSDKSVSEIISQLQNVSLFSSALFVVVKNCEQIKLKNDIDLIASYVKSASSSAEANKNTLILVSDENSVEKKLENCIPSSHKKIFWEMFENQKPQWVKNFFRKNGFGITDDAVDSVLNMVENNTQSLKNECSRFFYCFEKGHEVTASDVDKILTHDREENAFTLFEVMADSSVNKSKRLEDSLEILQKIRLSRESNGVAIIAGLSYCFRQLRSWHDIHSKNPNPPDSVLKTSGFAGKKNQERYAKAAKVWDSGQTSSIISLLATTDVKVKSEGSAMEDNSLTMLIYCIIIKNGLYPEVYQKY